MPNLAALSPALCDALSRQVADRMGLPSAAGVSEHETLDFLKLLLGGSAPPPLPQAVLDAARTVFLRKEGREASSERELVSLLQGVAQAPPPSRRPSEVKTGTSLSAPSALRRSAQGKWAMPTKLVEALLQSARAAQQSGGSEAPNVPKNQTAKAHLQHLVQMVESERRAIARWPANAPSGVSLALDEAFAQVNDGAAPSDSEKMEFARQLLDDGEGTPTTLIDALYESTKDGSASSSFEAGSSVSRKDAAMTQLRRLVRMASDDSFKAMGAAMPDGGAGAGGRSSPVSPSLLPGGVSLALNAAFAQINDGRSPTSEVPPSATHTVHCPHRAPSFPWRTAEVSCARLVCGTGGAGAVCAEPARRARRRRPEPRRPALGKDH